MRYYTRNNRIYDGVTTILDQTADYKTQMHLKNWLQDPANVSKAEAARSRGEYVHALVSKHLRMESYFVDPDYDQVWLQVKEQLEGLNNVIWSEGLLDGGHAVMDRRTITEHSMNDVVQTPAVWSEQLGYAGCPDIIATRNGKLTLADFKTSDCYYQRQKPKFDPERGEAWRVKTKGWHKYQRTVLQLCAYSIAIKETLGLDIESMCILVACFNPINCGFYTLREDEIEQGTEAWLDRLAKFKRKKKSNSLAS